MSTRRPLPVGSKSVILDASVPDAEARWERLRQISGDSDPFTNLSLVTELARLQQMEAKVLFLCADGADIAGLVATSRKLGPFLDCIPPRLVPVTPLLVASGNVESLDGERMLRSLGDCALRHSHRVTLVARTVRPLETPTIPWHAEILETYVLDLQELGEDIVDGWSAGARRTFRKNENRMNVTVDPSATAAAIRLCADSYSRAGRSFGIDTDGLRILVSRPPPGVSSTVFAAREESGHVVGSLIVLGGGATAYYWIAGSQPGPAMTVLIGHALRTLRAQRFRRFDFLGANVPSIAEFKRRFGPRLEQYTQIRASRSRTLDRLIAARESLRRILSG